MCCVILSLFWVFNCIELVPKKSLTLTVDPKIGNFSLYCVPSLAGERERVWEEGKGRSTYLSWRKGGR